MRDRSVPELSACSTFECCHEFHTSLHSCFAVKPCHCLLLPIILSHPFLVGLMLDFPAFGWLTGGCLETSLHIYTTAASLKLISHMVTPVTHRRLCVGVRTYIGGKKGKRSCHIAQACTRTHATAPRGTAPLNLIVRIHFCHACSVIQTVWQNIMTCTDRCRKCAENVRCPTEISCTGCMLMN